jgi:hypothetical protein
MRQVNIPEGKGQVFGFSWRPVEKGGVSIFLCKSPGLIEDEKGLRAALGLDATHQSRTQPTSA